MPIESENERQYKMGRCEAAILIGKKFSVNYLRHMESYPGFSEYFRKGFAAAVDEHEQMLKAIATKNNS